MSNDGENAISLLQQVRKFLGEVALLLQTADQALEVAGWADMGSQSVTGSSALGKSSEWLPYHVFRYYKNSDSPSIMPFVAVLLDYYDDDRDRGVKLLKVPLISCGWYDYGAAANEDGWIFYHSAIHIHNKGSLADGRWVKSEPQTLFPKWVRTSASVAYSRAIPLLSVKNAEDLQTKVIDPLLDEMKGMTTAKRILKDSK